MKAECTTVLCAVGPPRPAVIIYIYIPPTISFIFTKPTPNIFNIAFELEQRRVAMAEMVEPNYRKVMPLPASPSNTKTLGELMQMITIIDSAPSKDITTSASLQGYQHNPQEAWLPITESRNGNTFFAAFHLLCSGIGLQALLLPVALATLGW